MKGTHYNSMTHGPIPLSGEGRTLLQNLREAIQEAIKGGSYHDKVAHARGELATYMSKLEGGNGRCGATVHANTSAEVIRDQRGAMWRKIEKETATQVNQHQENTQTAERMRAMAVAPFKPFYAMDWAAVEKRVAAAMRGDMSAYETFARRPTQEDIYKTAYDKWFRAPVMYGGKLDENLAQALKPCPLKYMYASTGDGKITGNRAEMIMIDDCSQPQEIDMSKKAVAARKRVAKAEAKLQPVGVRFLHGPNLAKIYTYKAKRTAKLTLGQEVVVRNDHGTNVGVVVSLDGQIPQGWVLESLVELTHKVAPI